VLHLDRVSDQLKGAMMPPPEKNIKAKKLSESLKERKQQTKKLKCRQ
jgi:hypothetical protein